VEKAVLNSFILTVLTMTLLGVSPEYCVFCACNSSVKKEIVSFSFDDDDDDDEEKEKEKEEELFCLYFATTIVSS